MPFQLHGRSLPYVFDGEIDGQMDRKIDRQMDRCRHRYRYQDFDLRERTAYLKMDGWMD